MDWSDVAQTVGKIAPAAGGALAGPAGSAVGGLLARVLGVDASPEAVREAISQDPQAALKLREVEARLETSLIEGRAQVIQAEVNSESWLARSWRPMTMLWFALLVGLHWLGFTPDTLSDEIVGKLLDIVQYGLTGYIVGRSVEKTVKTATGTGLLDRIKTITR